MGVIRRRYCGHVEQYLVLSTGSSSHQQLIFGNPFLLFLTFSLQFFVGFFFFLQLFFSFFNFLHSLPTYKRRNIKTDDHSSVRTR